MAVPGSFPPISLPKECYGGDFHVIGGRNVELSQGNTVAQIGGTWKFKTPTIKSTEGTLYSYPYERPTISIRRLVFSSNPIKVGETFQVRVSQRKHRVSKSLIGSQIFHYEFVTGDKGCSHSDVQQNMAIGFIACDPARLLVIPEDGRIADGWCYSPDVWMLSEDRVYHDGRKEAKHNLCVYKPSDETIGCRVNEKGYLEFIKDGKNHGVVWSKPVAMPGRPLWGFVDLPLEYKIEACFDCGEALPHSYELLSHEEDQIPVTSSEFKEMAELEVTMQKNSQEILHMQKELASDFQKQLDALMDMQQQFQSQLTQLKSEVQGIKL